MRRLLIVLLLAVSSAPAQEPVFPYGAVYFRKSNPPEEDWERDHQTVGQLGSRLALDSGTLSPLLKRLTAAGLVTRNRRVEDERSVSIALTDEGRALRDRALAISETMIGAIGFDRGEFSELMQRLRLLTDRVNNGEPFCA